MVMAATTTKYVFDLQPGDVYWCTADCGWITGHTYLTYGPLLCGAQCVVFEGVPSYPTPGRSWQVVEKYNVSWLSCNADQKFVVMMIVSWAIKAASGKQYCHNLYGMISLI